jgi:serine protease AprX
MRDFRKRLFLVHIPLVLICLLLGLTTFGGPNGKAKGHDKIAPGLARLLQIYQTNPDMELPVIVQVDPDSFHPHGAPPGLLNTKVLGLVNGFAGKMSAKNIRALQNSPWIEYVTVDPVVQSTGYFPYPIPPVESLSLSNPFITSIGVDQLQDIVVNDGGTERVDAGYKGAGITVAVLDSGVSNEHVQLGSSITESVDFTSGRAKSNSQATADDFGHGTHVAGIIGATGGGTTKGVAPAVDLVSVKVLDGTGTGSTSNVIMAIDWVIQNKEDYNIQVANLSIGHPAFESYTADPLCQAVRAMVDAGIVTVVSAGNLGKTADYSEIWGGISSPGTEPSVITVGAVNTQGTATHTDDVATSYSSRGYSIPDQLFKPDLVAPGNLIPSTVRSDTYLRDSYPELAVDTSHMYLSGSSMATAFVTGSVALMLEANQDLSPTQVKTLLLLSAVKMTDPHMFEQGNGFLNSYTAVKLAEQMDVTNETLLAAVSPTWILNGLDGPEEVAAGGAFVWDDRIFYSDLVDVTGSFWGEGVIWADNLFDPGSVIWTDNFFDPGSVIWSDFFDSVIWADFFDGVIWADFFDSVIWADFFDSVIWADFFDGVIWADDFFDPDGVIWADSVIWTDDPANSTEGD